MRLVRYDTRGGSLLLGGAVARDIVRKIFDEWSTTNGKCES